jgi:hypothetical protein
MEAAVFRVARRPLRVGKSLGVAWTLSGAPAFFIYVHLTRLSFQPRASYPNAALFLSKELSECMP